ncbi:response regulator [Pseudoalteromonas xiamenensis]
MTFHILVVEDEPRIAQLVCKYLELESYTHTWVNNGLDAVTYAKVKQPDLCLLDIMLPDMDGIEVCKQLREFSRLPIIMMTAKVEEIDRLLGFKVGADDYVCKPFSPKELMARVNALLVRTYQTKVMTKKLVFQDLVMDVERFSVHLRQQEIKLTVNEFTILKAMLEQPSKVFSRKELLYAVKQKELDMYERTIDTHIKNLRKKLSTEEQDRDVIHSVYGIGYTLKPAI